MSAIPPADTDFQNRTFHRHPAGRRSSGGAPANRPPAPLSVFNPIFEVEFTGPVAGIPHLEPAFKAAVSLNNTVAVGAEYYGAFGPASALASADNQVHRVFAVVDLDFSAGRTKFDLNLAGGYGMGPAERWIAKLIFAVDLDPI